MTTCVLTHSLKNSTEVLCPPLAIPSLALSLRDNDYFQQGFKNNSYLKL